MKVEKTNKMVHEFKGNFLRIIQMVMYHSASIKQLGIQIDKISTKPNARQR